MELDSFVLNYVGARFEERIDHFKCVKVICEMEGSSRRFYLAKLVSPCCMVKAEQLAPLES
jgi:hypothetical protein